MARLAAAAVVVVGASCSRPPERVAFITAATPTITTTTTPRTTSTRAARSRTTPKTPVGRYTGDISALLDRLASCESGQNARAVSRNGLFWGAFQFMLRTWRGMGMSGNPIDYSYEEQKAVAARIPVSAWGRQFPLCARRLGVA